MSQTIPIHPLRRYRRRHKIALKQFAYAIGYDKSWLSKIERFRSQPGRELITRIIDVTDGELRFDDFRRPF
jgi:transcriptional regulator with XRE-family HTH domain